MDIMNTDDIENAGAFDECKSSPIRFGHRRPVENEVIFSLANETRSEQREPKKSLVDMKCVKPMPETDNMRKVRSSRKTRYVRWL